MKNYSKKLAKAKSLFSRAHDKTANLLYKVQMDINKREAKIEALQKETSELCAMKDTMTRFMSNLNKFME